MNIREKLKQAYKYITRGWNDEASGAIHPRVEIIPPIFFDVFRWSLIFAIVYKIVEYLFGLI